MLAITMKAALLLCLPVIALADSSQQDDHSPDKNGPGFATKSSLASAEDSGRIFHSALWTEKEVIVWGGGADGIFHNDGVRIEPGTKSSRPVTREGAPTGRWAHAAVWTGERMIIWGGRNQFLSSGHRADGALYDPAADAWKTMSTAGAPEARSQMAVAWSGREMLVWGGYGEGSTAWSSGGRYDPALDKWEPLPAQGAPSARVEPLSVWSGTEFIVWGGITPDLKRTLTAHVSIPLPTHGPPSRNPNPRLASGAHRLCGPAPKCSSGAVPVRTAMRM